MRVTYDRGRAVRGVKNGVTATPRPAASGARALIMFPSVVTPGVDGAFDGPMLFEHVAGGDVAAPINGHLDGYAGSGHGNEAWASIFAASPDGKWLFGHGDGNGSSTDIAIYEDRTGAFEYEHVVAVYGVGAATNPGLVQANHSNSITTTADGLSWLAADYLEGQGVIIYRLEPGATDGGFIALPEEYAIIDLPAGADGPHCFAWHPVQDTPGEPPLLAVGLGGTTALWIIDATRSAQPSITYAYVPADDILSHVPLAAYRVYALAWSPDGDQVAGFVKYRNDAGFPAGTYTVSRLTFWYWDGDSAVNQGFTTAGYNAAQIASSIYATPWRFSKWDDIGFLHWGRWQDRTVLFGVGSNKVGAGADDTIWDNFMYVRAWEMLSASPFSLQDRALVELDWKNANAIEPVGDTAILVAHGTDLGGGYDFTIYEVRDVDGAAPLENLTAYPLAALHDAIVQHVAGGGNDVSFDFDEGIVVVRSGTAAVPRETSTISDQRERVAR